jgi:hypothetical protein
MFSRLYLRKSALKMKSDEILLSFLYTFLITIIESEFVDYFLDEVFFLYLPKNITITNYHFVLNLVS